jgi:hypothetical protein
MVTIKSHGHRPSHNHRTKAITRAKNMKEAVILHLMNKPHHIHQMSIVTEDTVEEDRRNSTLQLLQSFLRLTANLLMPEEIIGNKYPLMQIFL